MSSLVKKYIVQISVITACFVLWLLFLLPTSTSLKLKNWNDASAYISSMVTDELQKKLKESKVDAVYAYSNGETNTWIICATGKMMNVQDNNRVCIREYKVGMKLEINNQQGFGFYAEIDRHTGIESILVQESLDALTLKHRLSWVGVALAKVLEAEVLNLEQEGIERIESSILQ